MNWLINTQNMKEIWHNIYDYWIFILFCSVENSVAERWTHQELILTLLNYLFIANRLHVVKMFRVVWFQLQFNFSLFP
jgi:hypothetical protein